MNKLLIMMVFMAPTVGLSANTVTGAGSSFAYPLLSRWATAYKAKTQQEINYQSIGSGGGLQQLTNQTVDFAAVDMPQTSETLAKQHWSQFPIAMGGIVIALNLPTVKNNQLRLSGPVLAKIFLGKVTRWNDPAIQKLNPHLKLPNLGITVVHRADGSGTTYNFTHYLNKVSPLWKTSVGASTEVDWPIGIGGKGSSGVAMFTQRIPGSISYVEYSFVQLTALKTAVLKNKAGNFVTPSPNTFNFAAKHASWNRANHYQTLLLNPPGKNSWPIMATTFALVPTLNKKLTKSKDAIAFFRWGYHNGQTSAKALDYVPLPNSTVQSISQDWQHSFKLKATKP